MLAALDSGALSGAVLDVTDPEPLPAGHPFWSHPRILLTPHNASMTSPDSAVDFVLDVIARHRRGEELPGLVDRSRGYCFYEHEAQSDPTKSLPKPQAPVLSVAGLPHPSCASARMEHGRSQRLLRYRAARNRRIVGESGSGKSVTALSIMRLIPQGDGSRRGQHQLSGTDLLTLSEAEMRGIRGAEIAMIFQEPMTSLNPVLTIGRQIAEALVQHRGLSRAAAEAEALRLLDRVRIPAAPRDFTNIRTASPAACASA